MRALVALFAVTFALAAAACADAARPRRDKKPCDVPGSNTCK